MQVRNGLPENEAGHGYGSTLRALLRSGGLWPGV